jgi:hypothetical protein
MWPTHNLKKVLRPGNYLQLGTYSSSMRHSAKDGFIQIKVSIPDLDIITTFRIGAYPGFIMNWGTLTAEVRQRY